MVGIFLRSYTRRVCYSIPILTPIPYIPRLHPSTTAASLLLCQNFTKREIQNLRFKKKNEVILEAFNHTQSEKINK